MKRKTKGYIVAVISILFSVFLIVLALALSNLAKGDTRERSQDTADYRKWSVPEKYTHFLIFPEEIPAEAEEVEYYYQYESGWDRPMSQIYLSYRLNENAYATEQERLSSLTYTDRTGETRSVEYDTTSFGYPAYVTIAGYDFCYEYALLNEPNRQTRLGVMQDRLHESLVEVQFQLRVALYRSLGDLNDDTL